jgi:hypothetical protein
MKPITSCLILWPQQYVTKLLIEQSHWDSSSHRPLTYKYSPQHTFRVSYIWVSHDSDCEVGKVRWSLVEISPSLGETYCSHVKGRSWWWRQYVRTKLEQTFTRLHIGCSIPQPRSLFFLSLRLNSQRWGFSMVLNTKIITRYCAKETHSPHMLLTFSEISCKWNRFFWHWPLLVDEYRRLTCPWCIHFLGPSASTLNLSGDITKALLFRNMVAKISSTSPFSDSFSRIS